MSVAFEKIIDLIGEKGAKLTQADMDQIESLIPDIPLDELPDSYGAIHEALALIVNDPAYEGDIEPMI
jgi:hypothetical protein